VTAQVAKFLTNSKNKTPQKYFFYHHTINTVIALALSGSYTIHSVLLTQELVKGSEDFPLCKDEVRLTVS